MTKVTIVKKRARTPNFVRKYRVLPVPWVQVKRKVPDSNSFDSSGAPTKAPTSIGSTPKTMSSPVKTSFIFWRALSRSPHGTWLMGRATHP